MTFEARLVKVDPIIGHQCDMVNSSVPALLSSSDYMHQTPNRVVLPLVDYHQPWLFFCVSSLALSAFPLTSGSSPKGVMGRGGNGTGIFAFLACCIRADYAR